MPSIDITSLQYAQLGLRRLSSEEQVIVAQEKQRIPQRVVDYLIALGKLKKAELTASKRNDLLMCLLSPEKMKMSPQLRRIKRYLKTGIKRLTSEEDVIVTQEKNRVPQKVLHYLLALGKLDETELTASKRHELLMELMK